MRYLVQWTKLNGLDRLRIDDWTNKQYLCFFIHPEYKRNDNKQHNTEIMKIEE